MHADRIKQLERFYQEDPADPFNIYALALEYLKSNPARSQELFDVLLVAHTEYLPTYYHAAKYYHESGDQQKAIEVFEKGIELARRLKDEKALRELRSAYDEMMFE